MLGLMIDRGCLPPPTRRAALRTGAIAVTDWRCHGRDSGKSQELAADYQIAVTRRGAYVRREGREAALAEAGVAVFYEPGRPHRIEHPASGGDTCTVFHLPVELLRELFAELAPRVADAECVRLPGTHVHIDSAALLACHAIARSAASASNPLAVEEMSIELVRRVLSTACRARVGATPDPRPSLAREASERVRLLIAEHFSERLTLAALSGRLGLSPYQLCRLFRLATGSTIHRHLTRVRLHHALEQMFETREHLAMVALGSGFASHSHFTDTFRREFGMAPSAVRRGALVDARRWRAIPKA
jgi:AraC family transcriptional regulator